MTAQRDEMELKEEAVRAHYAAAAGMLRGFDHAPRLGKAREVEAVTERSPGIGTRPRFRPTTPGLVTPEFVVTVIEFPPTVARNKFSFELVVVNALLTVRLPPALMRASWLPGPTRVPCSVTLLVRRPVPTFRIWMFPLVPVWVRDRLLP